MKLIFYGNQDNIGYRFCKWLRSLDYEIDLYIEENFSENRCLPEHDDPHIVNNYPEWIKKIRIYKLNSIFFPSQLKKKLKNYNILLTSGNYIIPALDADIPILFIPTGSDLNYLPFRNESLKGSFFSFIYRRRIIKVSAILVGQEDCVIATKFLGVYNKVERFSFPVDMVAYKRNKNNNLLHEIDTKFKDQDILFFNPSRKNLNVNDIAYKGNEKILFAFSKFLINNRNIKATLILGMHGADVSRFEDLIEELQIRSSCFLIPHLDLVELHTYLNLEKIVVLDQFAYSTYNILGGLEREAICFGTPVISALNTQTAEFIQTVGPNCPLKTAFTVEEIYNFMIYFSKQSHKDREEFKKNSIAWAFKYLHWENRIHQITNILQKLYTG